MGKTTLATNIAFYLSLTNRVLLIDADEQSSALDWANIRKEELPFSIVGMPKPIIHKEVEKIKKSYDYIIIDGPPRVHAVARSAIVASDLLLVPILPSQYDVFASIDIIKIINEVIESFSQYKKIEPFFVINRIIGNSIIGKEITKTLSEFNIPILKSKIMQRVIFAESSTNGHSVFEDNPSSLAAHEIKNLCQEIVHICQNFHKVKNND